MKYIAIAVWLQPCKIERTLKEFNTLNQAIKQCKELAKLVGKSVPTLSEHIKRGTIPPPSSKICRFFDNGTTRNADVWTHEEAMIAKKNIANYKRGTVVLKQAGTPKQTDDLDDRMSCIFNGFLHANKRAISI